LKAPYEWCTVRECGTSDSIAEGEEEGEGEVKIDEKLIIHTDVATCLV
jgi:hypothetical protein